MSRRTRARRWVAVMLSGAFVAVAGGLTAPAAQAAQIGTLTLDPATGSALSTPSIVTSGECPAGDLVRVKIWGGSGTGSTVPVPVSINSSGNFIGTMDPSGFVSGAGYALPATSDFATWATHLPTPLTALNGTYTVRAWCDSGDWYEGQITFTGTDLSNSATYVLGAGATAPGAPTAAKAVAGDARLTASWTAPADNGGAAITGYTVTAYPGGRHCTTTGALSCVVTGLVDGTTYYVKVAATNSVGTGAQSAASNAVKPLGWMRKYSTKVIGISGTTRVGSTVKAAIPYHTFYSSSGSIYAGITYTYQWKRGTTVIRGATRYYYRLVSADRGRRITVVVTAHKVGYRALAAGSKYIVPR